MTTTHVDATEPRPPAPADRRTATGADDEPTVIPVLEERLAVGTRRREIEAGVRIRKTVQAREERVDEPLRLEEVEVERVAVDRRIDAPVAQRYEGDTLIVPVMEEVLFVEKRLVLKEEIRITRRERAVRAPQRVELRREHATVERIEDAGTPIGPSSVGVPGCAEDAAESLIDAKRRHNEEVLRQLRRAPAGRADDEPM